MGAMRVPEMHTESSIPPESVAASLLVRAAAEVDDTNRLAAYSRGNVPVESVGKVDTELLMRAATGHLDTRGYIPRHAQDVLPPVSMTLPASQEPPMPRQVEFVLLPGATEWIRVGGVALAGAHRQ
jgi:hypothetical protein